MEETKEVKGVSFEELLDRINLDQARNVPDNIIVRKLISVCLIGTGKVEVKEPEKVEVKESEDDATDDN